MKKFYLSLLILLAAVLCVCACTAPPAASFDQKELSLTVGATATLTADVKGTEAVWASSDEGVVTVTPAEDGKTAAVKAVGTGSAEVWLLDGEEKLAVCTVTVTASPLSIFLDGKLVLRKNAEATVKALCTAPLEGEIVWESSDEKICTVEWQGLTARVKAVARGSATLTVRTGEYAASVTVFVGTT